jgi:mannose-6-phosphate isomerase-like protein (cupin superfamily)
MTFYPGVRYHGEGGEVSATFRPASTPPAIARPDGTAFHYLATRQSTDGDFGLYRVDMGPNSPGAANHFHRTISESFFVLSGTVRLFDGERWLDGTAGDFIYIPPGGLHAFKNESAAPASMLLLFAPGADREGYFEGLRGLGSMNAEERDAFFRLHDNLFLSS